jgi:hypothetical protein
MLSLSVPPRDWSSVNAQAPTAPRMRSRDALKAGQEAYQENNYEDADNYLRQAQAGISDLNYAERADLDHYMRQNTAALEARRDGVAMMRRLEQAIAENRMLEAADLAKALMLKRDFLAAPDRDKCNQLLDRTWSWDGSHGSAAPANTGSQGAEVLAHNKLKHAQGLLAQGRFDAADQLVHEVEK